jgi:hypothetical protein
MLQQPLGLAEITRLKEIVDEAVKTYDEIESLREGISETIDAVSEELNIPNKLLKKAVTIVRKGSFKDEEDELSTLDQILTAIGRK